MSKGIPAASGFSGWTEERTELLKKLWLEGLSASQIAKIIGEGITRNSVIGKVHRLKLSGRAKTQSTYPHRVRAAPPRVPRPSPPPRTPAVGPSTSGVPAITQHRRLPLAMPDEPATDITLPVAAELFIPPELRRSLFQLNEHTCKWPIGDPLSPNFYFCGSHTEGKKPYCEFHSRRAFHPTKKKGKALV